MKARKGFTLVELLIVIIIIGILAAAMLLSSGSATASAEASNIVNNLRSLKSASLLYYADKLDAMRGDNAADVPLIDDIKKYMDNPNAPGLDGYTIVFVGDGNWGDKTWYIGAPVSRADVKTRLQGRAESIGLYNAATAADPAKGDYSTGDVCYILIRSARDIS